MSATTDWPRLLDDIAYLNGGADFAFPGVRTPVGQPRLAAYLHVHRSTVRNWIDGAEPKHSDGEQLIAVWVKLTGNSLEFVPVALMPISASVAHRDSAVLIRTRR